MVRELKPVTTRREVYRSLLCCLGFAYIVVADGTPLTVWGLNFVLMAMATAQAELAYRIQKRLITLPTPSGCAAPG